jgi:cystathionine beta-lyase/cystathionine gamma-synthase
MPEANRKMSDLPENLVRIYIGLDEADYLIKDLQQALDKI